MEQLSVGYDSIQFVIVKFGDEQFGIDIKFIDNIVRMQRITRVPKVQHYFKGVINLRGEIIPVMSIRLKMGLEEDEVKRTTRIIIIKMEGNDAVGLLVDEVLEVVTLSSSQIERVVYDSKEEKANFIFGVGKDKEKLISLLDLNLVLADKDGN